MNDECSTDSISVGQIDYQGNIVSSLQQHCNTAKLIHEYEWDKKG